MVRDSRQPDDPALGADSRGRGHSVSTKDQLDVREDRLLGRRRQVLAPAPERLEEATVLGAHLVLTHPKPLRLPRLLPGIGRRQSTRLVADTSTHLKPENPGCRRFTPSLPIIFFHRQSNRYARTIRGRCYFIIRAGRAFRRPPNWGLKPGADEGVPP